MQNDSIETLLLRHYGSQAPAPPELTTRLTAVVQQQASEAQAEQRIAEMLRHRRISRRSVTRWVALGATGAGILSVGLEGLQTVETALFSPSDNHGSVAWP